MTKIHKETKSRILDEKTLTTLGALVLLSGSDLNSKRVIFNKFLPTNSYLTVDNRVPLSWWPPCTSSWSCKVIRTRVNATEADIFSSVFHSINRFSCTTGPRVDNKLLDFSYVNWSVSGLKNAELGSFWARIDGHGQICNNLGQSSRYWLNIVERWHS